MTAIPEDILREASNVAEQHYELGSWQWLDLRDITARALQAERTRAQTETARLLLAAKILYANAYNGLAAEEGREIPDYDLPGWLADCKADIAAFPGAQEQEKG